MLFDHEDGGWPCPRQILIQQQSSGAPGLALRPGKYEFQPRDRDPQNCLSFKKLSQPRSQLPPTSRGTHSEWFARRTRIGIGKRRCRRRNSRFPPNRHNRSAKLTDAPTGGRAGRCPGCVCFRPWGLPGGSGAWSRGMDGAGGWAAALSRHGRATDRIREASGWLACDRGWCSLRRWLSR